MTQCPLGVIAYLTVFSGQKNQLEMMVEVEGRGDGERESWVTLGVSEKNAYTSTNSRPHYLTRYAWARGLHQTFIGPPLSHFTRSDRLLVTMDEDDEELQRYLEYLIVPSKLHQAWVNK